MYKKNILILHDVEEHHSFKKAANDIFNVIAKAQQTNPGGLRILSVAINSHKNDNNEFDDDMRKLHRFIIQEILPYLTEVAMPLGRFTNINQRDDIPESLNICSQSV